MTLPQHTAPTPCPIKAKAIGLLGRCGSEAVRFTSKMLTIAFNAWLVIKQVLLG